MHLQSPNHVNIKREADDLLHQRGLLAVLAPWGEVFIGGSYYYDLMCWRDLDIYIKAPQITIAAFFQLGAEITTHFTAYKSYFTDNRRQGPDGLYWGIRLGDTRTGEWKLDIWALSEADYQQHVAYAQQMTQLLTPATRDLILQIKGAYWHTAAYRDQVTSHQIYDAVLHQHVTSLEEFEQHLQNHV